VKLAFAVLFVAAGGCQGTETKPLSLHDQRQAALNQIADKCGVPRSTFDLVGDEDLHIQARADEKYERVECALTELKRSNLPVKMGFIGNEYYSNEVE